MASFRSLQHLPNFRHHKQSFEADDRAKLRVNASFTSKLNQKELENYELRQRNLACGPLPACSTSSQVILSRSVASRALSSTVSSADPESDQTEIEHEPSLSSLTPVQSHDTEFNRVNCLVWVLHESSRSFSLAVQTLKSISTGPEHAMAWSGVDVHSWHKRIAYQVAVYALLKAAIEVELFLSHKASSNPSSVHVILAPKINYLGEYIESQISNKHPKLVQWFRMVELPRITGLFIPLFKKWSMDYAGSGVAGIILAISCCAAVRKLGPDRISYPLYPLSIDDVLVELMDLSHNLVSVDKLHHLATEAGFEEDFLSHFGTKILPAKNNEEVEFWIGLVHRKLSKAFYRESVISGKATFANRVHDNSLATLGLFAFLGKQTRLFLSKVGIKDVDEQVKDFLSYLECGCLFIFPEFASLSEYQLFMEVVTDEIGWLDFYAAFSCTDSRGKKRSKHANQAETEISLYTIFTVCSDVFSGFAHFSNSAEQSLGDSLLSFLLKSQSLLSVCLEDYWAAYDRSSELPSIAERSEPSLSSRIRSTENSTVIMEAYAKLVELMEGKGSQLGNEIVKETKPPRLEGPEPMARVVGHTAAETLSKSLLRKSAMKLISASIDVWLGTQLLYIDIFDAVKLSTKKLRGDNITKRERKKISRTLADIVSLVPITIFMLLPISPVGHAALLAAIQKYMPCLIPTPYSPERLDFVKQHERIKKMRVQMESDTKDAAAAAASDRLV